MGIPHIHMKKRIPEESLLYTVCSRRDDNDIGEFIFSKEMRRGLVGNPIPYLKYGIDSPVVSIIK